MSVLALALLLVQAQPAAAPAPVVVGSKPFGESYILAEIFAQLMEARGIAVDRRPGLGATEIAFGALRSGAADVYPEYTGTGLLAILGRRPPADPRADCDGSGSIDGGNPAPAPGDDREHGHGDHDRAGDQHPLIGRDVGKAGY